MTETTGLGASENLHELKISVWWWNIVEITISGRSHARNAIPEEISRRSNTRPAWFWLPLHKNELRSLFDSNSAKYVSACSKSDEPYDSLNIIYFRKKYINIKYYVFWICVSILNTSVKTLTASSSSFSWNSLTRLLLSYRYHIRKAFIYSLFLHHLLEARVVAQVGRFIAIRCDVPALLRRSTGFVGRDGGPLRGWKCQFG